MAQQEFGLLPGVTRARAGYAGSSALLAEAVEVEFDPLQVSYQELLELFFHARSAGLSCESRYRSVIWYHSRQQREAAELELQRLAGAKGRVDLEPVGRWQDAGWGPGGCF